MPIGRMTKDRAVDRAAAAIHAARARTEAVRLNRPAMLYVASPAASRTCGV